MRRTDALIALAAVVTLTGLTGCASDRAGSAEPTPGATQASVRPLLESRIQDAVVEPGVFTGDVVAVWGQEEVDLAYEEMAQLSAEITFDEELLASRPEDTWSPEEFDRVAQQMTPEAAEAYREMVRSAVHDEDEQAASTLQGITFHNAQGEGVALATDGPLVVNHQISDPFMTVDRSAGDERLEVTFEQRGDLRMDYDGQPSLVAMQKTISFWLVPAPAGGQYHWLIDSIDNEWSVGAPVPDTGSY